MILLPVLLTTVITNINGSKIIFVEPFSRRRSSRLIHQREHFFTSLAIIMLLQCMMVNSLGNDKKKRFITRKYCDYATAPYSNRAMKYCILNKVHMLTCQEVNNMLNNRLTGI